MGGSRGGTGPSARQPDVERGQGRGAPSAAARHVAVLQPHGALLVANAALVVQRATENADVLLGVPRDELLGRPLAALAPDLARQVGHAARAALLVRPTHIPHRVDGALPLDVCVHRAPGGELVVELEPSGDAEDGVEGADGATLARLLTDAVASVRAAPTLAALHEVAVRELQRVTGYERVTLFRMPDDGRGRAVAAVDRGWRDDAYPARRTAPRIPAAASDRLVRRRVCVVVDAQAAPVALAPATGLGGEAPDLSIAHLRAPDRVQRRILERGGARAGLFAPLVHEDRVWGLVVGEHRTPRCCPPAVRLACELLAEVVATRVAALESGVHARAAAHVRLLQRRLADATAATADWRPALLQDAPLLLRLVRADGLVLFSEGEVHPVGDMPSTAVLRDVGAWVARQPHGPAWSCRSLAETPMADRAGVHTGGLLSAALMPYDGEYLMWYRSPGRTGRCAPWSAADLGLAAEVRDAVARIAVQMRAVGMLVAEQQAALARDRAAALDEPLVVADAGGDVILVNDAFTRLVARPHDAPLRVHDLATLFQDAARARDRLRTLTIARESWRDDLVLRGRGERPVPVAVRAEVIPGPHGTVLGYTLVFADLSGQHVADAARQRLRGALHEGADEPLLDAVRANARDAADELAGDPNPGAESLVGEVERSLRRATDLSAQILARPDRADPRH